MDSDDTQRLMTKVARLYHTHGLRQGEIGERLDLSQSKVSRLLTKAEESDIVRTVVAVPVHMHSELEEAVEDRYGLAEVHVVETTSVDDYAMIRELAASAAAVLGEFSLDAPTVGWSSWSRTLQATVDQLMPLHLGTGTLIEMVGDLGPPELMHESAHSTQVLAAKLGAEPLYLRAPGVVATAEVAQALVGKDTYAGHTLRLLDDLDLALVSIGATAPSSPIAAGRNFFTAKQLQQVKAAGAVGEICMRYVDAKGDPVHSPLDELTIAVSLDQLRRARRRFAVVGGRSKHKAVRAALTGGWVDVLITDLHTARYLAAGSSSAQNR